MDQQSSSIGGLPSLDNGSHGNQEITSSTDNAASFASMPQSSMTEPASQDAANKQPKTAAIPLVATPSMADDVDLIEKDWVNKVKEVINKTKDNPYEQARQLALIKSDYLQKRYNKSVTQEQ